MTIRVTQAGSYVELSDNSIGVTQAGVYIELAPAQLRITQEGAYVEIAPAQLRSTQTGAYIELGPVQIRITQAGAYIEIYEPEEEEPVIPIFVRETNFKPLIPIQPALNKDSRIFISVNDERYQYYHFMKLDTIDKSYGEVNSVWCPDPDRYSHFIEADTFISGEGRYSASLMGRLPKDKVSKLKELSDIGCTFNVQAHFGICNKPYDFNDFDSAIILENVTITNYSTESLGALSPDEAAMINETVSISFENLYFIYKLQYGEI